ncbi:histidine kinase [Henriciella sp. AS95]|uniref:sensor histidine kinase n=1 Tax=Henriciella sp. AS95 TaxID=3135782 RepID=UPI00316EEC53
MTAINAPDGMFKTLGLGMQPTNRQYWLFQIAGWSAMALLSYLSLTVWYNPGQWTPVVHTILQSALGIFVSHPLRWVASGTWKWPLVPRILVNGACVIIASIVWTLLRLYSFTWMTGEPIPLADWGGWWFASVIVFGAWTFCYYALKYYQHWIREHQLAVEAQNTALKANEVAQRETLRRLEAEKQFRDAQLRMLKYQLNPHFLFNALNSVSWQVRKGDSGGATDMLARIGDYLRVTLDHSDEMQHTLADELETLDLYLSIEKVRFGDRLHTRLEVEDAARDAVIPSLLLQPLFENSVKFAVSKTTEPITASLDARRVGDELVMVIEDDGPGVGKQTSPSDDATRGIGLLNVEERLKSAYGEDFRFRHGPIEPHGYKVEISIPARGRSPQDRS